MNKLGFGFLRLPFRGENVDEPAVCQLVDFYLAQGGRYFDTAYTYLDGKSEAAIGSCLASRYDRSRFLLADKLPGYKAHSRQDCQRFFDLQLQRCQVSYFDVYLIHWLNAKHYQIAEQYDEFAFLQRLKEQGLVRKTGFSYHDTAALLDEILQSHPEVDYVQLQLNYLDWESPSIQSRLCYETAVRHGKQVIVMEPVKGGTLAKLPPEAARILQEAAPGESPASQALRFAQSLPGVEIVLSGMNSLEQLADNLRDTPPMPPTHAQALQQAAQMLRASTAVACTGCGYCRANCPRQIAIPQYFALYNDYARAPGDAWKITPAYARIADQNGKASDCVQCGACEENCPQKLPIRDTLKQVAAALEPKN